jgi:pimeloyl-ACP methyl ester carboxylesterase
LLLLHGFPTSSFDWRFLLAHQRDRAMLAFDCLGFGLSDKPREHTYSLAWQADAAEELVRRGSSGPVFVVAHDMGTSVATELMARDIAGQLSFAVTGALLFNGSILLDRAHPTIGQKLLRSRLGPVASRLTSEATFRAQFGRIFSRSHPLDASEAADQWSLIAHNSGHRMGHRLVPYMDERELLADRWHGAIREWPGRLSLAWGTADPVATTDVLAGLRELRPGVPVSELPGVGHYPQLERPDQLARILDHALARCA